MREFSWKSIHSDRVPSSQLRPIQKKFGLGKVASEILYRRGIRDHNTIHKFLYGQYADLYDPFMFSDMSDAVSRILQARAHQEHVFIHGDYDCDGVCSAALVKILCENIGIRNAKAFVPTRDLGYGLASSTLQSAIDDGYTLIITCDCGSREFESHALAKKHNVDIIVLDHHSYEERPDVFAFINPNEKAYPFSELCGAGVVFKFMQAVDKYLPVYPQEYTDLVAMATVADSEPLVDENRILVREGLKRLEHTSNPGLYHLIKVSSLENRKITAEMIGFILAPKINAAGRINDPNISLNLLLTQDQNEADQLAHMLAQINRKRMDINSQIRDEAIEMIETQYKDDRVIVLSKDSWHKGVVGIVASTIVEIYHKPCIIFTEGYGSARTIPKYSLLKPLKACEDLFTRWGGHPMAAGIRIDEGNVEAFRKRINELAKGKLPQKPKPSMSYDFKLVLKDVSMDLVEDIEKLEPFGQGNAVPLFVVEDLAVARDRVTNDGQHLQLSLMCNNSLTSAIGFWMATYKDMIFDPAQKFDVLFQVERSRLGSEQIIVRDLKEVDVRW